MSAQPLLKRLLFWTPRMLCILFAVFISLFALDVFGEGRGFGATIVALAIHLLPTLLVVAALAIAWRWEAAGGALLIALAAWYLIWAWGHYSWIAGISGPPFLAGVLFVCDSAYRARLRRGG